MICLKCPLVVYKQSGFMCQMLGAPLPFLHSKSIEDRGKGVDVVCKMSDACITNHYEEPFC